MGVRPAQLRSLQVEVTKPAPTPEIDLATLGARIRHARNVQAMTLATLARRVDRAPSLLSQIENGKREPKVSLLSAIAAALDVTVVDLMKPQAPSERTALELELRSRQESDIPSSHDLPNVHVGPRLPLDALKALVQAYRHLDRVQDHRERTPEAAREANVVLRDKVKSLDNYLENIEELATSITLATGHSAGPLPESGVEEIATYLGFRLVRVSDLPQAARSITDLRNRRIYLPEASRGDKDPRMVVLRALGDHALEHQVPKSFGEFLRQRVESNYFASAMLLPEASTVDFLRTAMEEKDIALSDLRDMSAVRYETAVHRFTNLATRHLGLKVHFLRVGEDGVIYKAYANNAMVFPADVLGSIEGQLACRHLAARRVFDAPDRFGPYFQYTDTPQGTYWEVSKVEKYKAGNFSITLGVPFEQSSYFRGRETSNRHVSSCPKLSCCMNPTPQMDARWAEHAWPSVRVHSHMLAAVPSGSFPGLNEREVYEFLETHAAEHS